ncbi:MAG: dihydropteroate synthase [Bacteroidaceae bacterium]|nr:dihydropteroate synthase [Bacteroidaceae bacterium]
MKKCYTININGQLVTTQKPLVMGILNVTPDSFYASSRVTPACIADTARAMLDAGADILDIGACSTRPGAEQVSQCEELKRLHAALDIIDKECPCAVVSVDTYRAQVATEMAARHNVAIINDVSGFEWDNKMLDAVAAINKPYVLTHSKGVAGDEPQYDNFLPNVIETLAAKIWQLRQRGVRDIIVDPGFGFGKSMQQNYCMMNHLAEFGILDAPLLVGVSRKSMLTKLLSISADDALCATTVLNTIALMNGAHILRVHDVKQAVQAVKVFSAVEAATMVE